MFYVAAGTLADCWSVQVINRGLQMRAVQMRAVERLTTEGRVTGMAVPIQPGTGSLAVRVLAMEGWAMEDPGRVGIASSSSSSALTPQERQIRLTEARAVSCR